MPANDKAPERAQVSVTIDAEVAAILEREAAARMLGKGYLVQMALECYLPQLPPLPGATSFATSTSG